VAFRSSELLAVQHEWLDRLNRGRPIARWIVMENSALEDPFRLSKHDQRFHVLPGAKRPQGVEHPASHQHAKALNRALPLIDTRYLLVIDPDFFPVQRDWVPRLLAHVERRRLAFFGAPWHPRWYRKWRRFPCSHFLLIDLEQVDRDELDFVPDFSRQPAPYVSRFLAEHEWMRCRGGTWAAWWMVLRHPGVTLVEDRRQRLIIGTSRDTGIKLYERFGNRPGFRHETFTPVYRPREDRLIPPPGVRPDTRSALRELLELVRPDWLSFVPRRAGSFSRKSFRDFGLPDLRARGWEELLWQGRPAAFHLRGFLNPTTSPTDQAAEVRRVLDTIHP
jgi:hypothetical protein